MRKQDQYQSQYQCLLHIVRYPKNKPPRQGVLENVNQNRRHGRVDVMTGVRLRL